ncbi:hypothetical protein BJV82DRAFT_113408 [Fennellomyces sp. T-0311]|nr:hypothetical protein BJV82DRAFT_113408 [Fennellomyces sp. T-0311]
MMQIYTRIPKESPLLPSAVKITKGIIEPGKFMLDTGVLRKRIITDDLERRTLHQILKSNSGQHSMIWVGSRTSRVEACPWTSEFWSKFTSSNYAAVRPIVIESTWHVHESTTPDYVDKSQWDLAEEAFWTEDHWDANDSVSKRVGLVNHMRDKESPAAIVIVRPDLYIAYSSLVTSPKHFDTAFAHLDSYLKRNVNA